MRITFLLPSLKMGGGVKSTLELANRLQAKGHRVTVVYPVIPGSGGYPLTDARKTAHRCLRAGKNLLRKPGVGWFPLQAGLLRVPTLAAKHVPDADIVVATWWENAYDVNRYGRGKGEKFYFIRHYETWGGPEKLVDATYTLPLRRVTTSTWLKGLIEDKFGVEVKGPLPNGIDSDVFYLERDGFEAHSPKRVGIMSRLNQWKGIDDGLKAIAMARKECPGFAVVVFGEEPGHDPARMIKEIGGVEYHRTPHGARLREIYNSLDIFILPSHSEGFGNPPMEAMACGAACVTTRVGAVPDFTIPGVTACVVEPGEPAGLAREVLGLLSDEPRRQAMAEAGYRHMQGFGWDRTVDELEAIFLAAL